ncbi:unnamed protein product [Lupinus luteus]|uniref:Uncharacterized protein n=1 Tax=Lupinus luteus TaxID=3873 RepID=A0AAV1Y3V5_LUPLU
MSLGPEPGSPSSIYLPPCWTLLLTPPTDRRIHRTTATQREHMSCLSIISANNFNNKRRESGKEGLRKLIIIEG